MKLTDAGNVLSDLSYPSRNKTRCLPLCNLHNGRANVSEILKLERGEVRKSPKNVNRPRQQTGARYVNWAFMILALLKTCYLRQLCGGVVRKLPKNVNRPWQHTGVRFANRQKRADPLPQKRKAVYSGTRGRPRPRERLARSE